MSKEIVITNRCLSELCDAVKKIDVLLRVLDEHHIEERCENELEFFFTMILLAREQAEALRAVVNDIERSKWR